MRNGYGNQPGAPSGTPGRNGNTVRHGSNAPTPDVGRDGDFYIESNEHTWAYWGPKVAGDWGPRARIGFILAQDLVTGPQGPNGTDGVDGTNGRTVLNGTTPPTDDVGNNNDYYVDTTTWTIWGPKASGTWAGTSCPLAFDNAETELTTNATTISSWSDLLSCTLTTVLDALDVHASFSGRADPGDTAMFRLTLDGDPLSGGSAFQGLGSGLLCKRVDGLSPGEHTVALQWASKTGDGVHIAPVTHVDSEHASLLVTPSK